MTRFTNLFGVALVSASLYADPQQRPATENERHRGLSASLDQRHRSSAARWRTNR
jgi:hypothetical protein